jgi:hypothetical protein
MSTRPIDRVLTALRHHGCQPKRCGNGWVAKCPAHDDRHASLSIAEGDDGRVLLCCHAGCRPDEVLRALGLTWRDLHPAQDGPGRTPRLRNNQRDTRTPQTFQTAQEAVAHLEHRHGKRSASWTYYNVQSEPVGVVLRWDNPNGKEIRPVSRHPDGWRISAMPEPRPLYRLRELLATPQNTWIWVVEGEKAADALATCGLCATTSAGGAKAAHKTDWTPLAGRRVVVLPDADDAGERYAEDVSRLTLAAGATDVRILRLREHASGLPPGGDLADVLADERWCGLPLGDAAEPADLGRLLEDLAAGCPVETVLMAQPTADTEDITPRPTIPEWEAFPVHVLPAPVREFTEAAANSIGCDASMVALPLLAVLARCIGNRRTVQLHEDWTEPAVIWAAVIAPSGTRKSPAFDVAVRVLERRQDAADLEYGEAMRRYEAELRAKSPESAAEPPQPPRCEQYILTDTTLEALAIQLSEQSDGVLMACDELTAWVESFNQYRGGRGSDVGHWLACWRARSLRIRRKYGTQRIHIPRAAVSIVGGIQPEIFRRALSREHLHDGLCARLLVAMPPDDRDPVWGRVRIGRARSEALERVVDGLLNLPGDTGPRGPEPRRMGLDHEAERLFIEFFYAHRRAMRHMDEDLRMAASKLEAYAARFALLFACVRGVWAGGDPATIDHTSMAAGIELSQWFLREAERAYSLFHETREDKETRQLAEWIERRGGAVTARDLYCQGPRQFRGKASEAEQALDALVRAGCGVWEIPQVHQGGGRPTRVFRLQNSWMRNQNPKKTRESEGFDSAASDSGGGASPSEPSPTAPAPPAEKGGLGGQAQATKHWVFRVSGDEPERTLLSPDPWVAGRPPPPRNANEHAPPPEDTVTEANRRFLEAAAADDDMFPSKDDDLDVLLDGVGWV